MTKNRVVVAGAGLGGLICGYMLAKNGYKVVVLEKNFQIGGCLQTFVRRGVKFGTGMHYIGSVEEGQVMHQIFKYLNLLEDVQLSFLDKSCYDVIMIGKERYNYATGVDNFVAELSKQFPENIEDIKEYVKKITSIANSSPIHNVSQIGATVFMETEYVKKSVSEFISEITNNARLQAVLCGNMMLYAGVKDKTPVYLHALLTSFYSHSPCRIVDGSDSIANSLAKSIKQFGGEILINSEVEEFVCNQSEMTHVRLRSGKEIPADYFISDINPKSTIKLIKSNLLRDVYKNRINSIEDTISCFSVFIKFKKDRVKYLNSNFFCYPDYNIWDSTNYTEQNWGSSYYYMHQASLPDNLFAESAELVSYMRFEDVARWQNTTVGKRGDSYLEFKQSKAEKLLGIASKQFEELKDHIEYYCTATPLTYRDYTGSHRGSMYGILRDKNIMMQTKISQRTKIPNFFFTGQNINSHGLIGVAVGAMVTCSEFLDKEKLIKQIYSS